MPIRIFFTTRDWLWFCIVMALAIGWGTHVRYSTLLESPALSTPYSAPMGYDQLQQENNVQRDRMRGLKRENAALLYAVEQTLSDDKKKEFMANKKHMEEVLSVIEQNREFSP